MLRSMRMFFKYDGSAILRTLWPLLAAIVGCGVLCCGLDALLPHLMNEKLNAFYTICLGTQVSFVLAVVVLTVVSTFLVFSCFYRTMFTDEGYLTMVLPVGTHTLLLSKLLVGLVGVLGIIGVGVISLSICYLPSNLSSPSYGDIGPIQLSSEIVLYIVSLVAQALCIFILIYASMVLGAVCFKRHAIIGSLIFAFGLLNARSILASVFVLTLIWIEDFKLLDMLSSLIQLILSIGIGVALYFLMHRLLSKRFNIT